MKLFYTEKEMQKEIDRRLYEESERFQNSRRICQIEHEAYELRSTVEKLRDRIDKIECHTRNWKDNGNETISCPHCGTWFPKEREPYMKYCGFCGKRIKTEVNDG